MTFRDQGIGLRDKEIRQAFMPFKGDFDRGSGLGLAIVYRMVQDYNGSIQVNRRLPQGTEVSVHFPLDRRTFE